MWQSWQDGSEESMNKYSLLAVNMLKTQVLLDEDPDPVIFGPPDPDPTCNNGFIKLFLSYKLESTNSSIK